MRGRGPPCRAAQCTRRGTRRQTLNPEWREHMYLNMYLNTVLKDTFIGSEANESTSAVEHAFLVLTK